MGYDLAYNLICEFHDIVFLIKILMELKEKWIPLREM